MKNTLLKLALFTALSLPMASAAHAASETFNFDPNHTNLTWHANHFGFSNPSGKFTDVTGTLVLDEAAPEKSKVNVTIKPASILTGIEKFDTHLKSKDFLDVVAFPSAEFVSSKVTKTTATTAKVEGTLTIHGISKPATLDVTLNKIGENPMSKIKTAGFTATTTIKRSEFGIMYALPGVSDDVKIAIEVEANKVSDAAPAVKEKNAL